MRQRRWLELAKDYDYTILYHQRKANIVADALSWKATLVALNTDQLAQEFFKMEIKVISIRGDTASISTGWDIALTLATLMVQPMLRDRIKQAQGNDSFVYEIKERARKMIY